MIIEITKENYEAEVVNSDKPVLIDFWAEWCGPCRMLAPTIDAFAEERNDIKVGKINVDNEEALCVKFGIDSIPTLIILKKGEIAGKQIGYNSRAIVESFIDKSI
ncbi:MAG: thioredoxin [Clostridia bacterium]|nr:thioredoxin [Clostridia bacterium]